MVDVSIIIPHRGSALGLWATINSCDEDLRGTKLTYNYVVVSNGGPIDTDTANFLGYLNRTGRLLRHLHSDAVVTPPSARSLGAEVADGEILCFLDNHCLVGRRYFDRVVADFGDDKKHVDMLHSAYCYHTNHEMNYHYRLKLAWNFWADSSAIPQSEFCIYQLAGGGHGGFAVRKSVWDAVGGYGPDGVLVGYGGEELGFDFKLWRYGYTVWMDPKLMHYHYAGARGYSRHFTDEYYTNMMACANMIGGEKWLYKVYESFSTKKHLRVNPANTMYELLETAYERSADYARVIDSKSKYSLDELLNKWPRECVAM